MQNLKVRSGLYAENGEPLRARVPNMKIDIDISIICCYLRGSSPQKSINFSSLSLSLRSLLRAIGSMAQFIVQGRHSPFTQICIPAERRGRPRRRAPMGHQGKMRRTEGNSGNVATTTKWTPSRRPMCIHIVTFLCRVDSTYLEWPNVLTEPLWTSAKLDCVMRWLKRV